MILHITSFAAWFAIHLSLLKPLDPYPYMLLGVLVSVESVLQSTLVLMMQNRMQQRADDWVHLNERGARATRRTRRRG